MCDERSNDAKLARLYELSCCMGSADFDGRQYFFWRLFGICAVAEC
jgi:hypothetical protein